MEAKMSKFFDSVGTFFTGADNIPWCDRDIIADKDDDCMRLHSNHGYKGIKGEGSASSREGYRSRRRGRVAEGEKGCEGQISEAATEEQKNDSIMRLSWALVHSRQTDDVNRGIGMIEATLDKSTSPLQTREKLYLMAVGHYRTGNYVRSRQLADHCLEIQPDWRQASSLKKAIEDKIAKDGVIGIGIATTAVGLIVGGIAAALARRN